MMVQKRRRQNVAKHWKPEQWRKSFQVRKCRRLCSPVNDYYFMFICDILQYARSEFMNAHLGPAQCNIVRRKCCVDLMWWENDWRNIRRGTYIAWKVSEWINVGRWANAIKPLRQLISVCQFHCIFNFMLFFFNSMRKKLHFCSANQFMARLSLIYNSIFYKRPGKNIEFVKRLIWTFWWYGSAEYLSRGLSPNVHHSDVPTI